MHSIFVFGKPSGYEYIRYSYSGKISFVFSQEFDIRVTLIFNIACIALNFGFNIGFNIWFTIGFNNGSGIGFDIGD